MGAYSRLLATRQLCRGTRSRFIGHWSQVHPAITPGSKYRPDGNIHDRKLSVNEVFVTLSVSSVFYPRATQCGVWRELCTPRDFLYCRARMS